MATSAFKSSVSPTKIRKPTIAASPTASKSDSGVIEVKGVLAYPSLSAPDPKSGDKYSTLILVTDQEDQQALMDLVQETTEQTFRSEEMPFGAHNPLRESNEKNHAGEYAFKHPAFRAANGMVIRAKTSFMPRCVSGEGEVEIDPSEISGGDLVVVEISAYGYSNQSQGVALSLGRVWLIEKGQTKIERGSGAGASNVKRIDRSRLRFTSEVENGAA